jgi:hypothetical protein
MHVRIESQKKIPKNKRFYVEYLQNSQNWETIEECVGTPFSHFDHLDRNELNERLDLNVRVGMTADTCSGPLSRTPLRLASSVFYRSWVSDSKFLQKIELETGHMRPTKNV